MIRKFYVLAFALCCILFTTCKNTTNDTVSPCDLTNIDKLLLKELYDDTTTPDSTLHIVENIVTDSMRWWGMDKIYNESDSAKNAQRSQFKNINIALDWTRHHPGQYLVEGKIWNQKGILFANNNELDSALLYFQNAYQLISKTKAYRDLSTSAINLAMINYRKGNTPAAAKYYKRAALLADSLQITQNRISIHIGLAQVYTDLHNFKLAQQHLDQAQKYISNANIYEKFYYYNARGICYYYQKENGQAYAAFNVTLKYANKIGEIQQVLCQASLGESALMTGHNEIALHHINRCIRFLKEHEDIGYNTLKFYLCSLSADVLLANGKNEEAEKLLEQLPPDKNVKMKRYLYLHYNRLSSYAEKRKNYRKAYQYLNIAKTYKDSINNENTVNNIIEISQRYQRDTTLLRQHYAIATIEADNTHRLLQLICIIGGLCLIITIFIFAFVLLRRNHEKQYHMQIQKISQLRMDVVRNRLSPHYVFNVLGMMLPKFKSNPELHQLSELFIDVLRSNLMASYLMSVKLSEEIRLVKQYITLYHKTTSAYPTINWHDATNGEVEHLQVPTMCIQIPVENALKHAFREHCEKDTIDIFIVTEKKRLILDIIDNGEGYNPGKIISTGRDTGTGLRALSRTLSLLNQQNSNAIEFFIRNLGPDGGKGTKVHISIPFDYQYSEGEK